MDIQHIYSYTATYEDGSSITMDANDINSDVSVLDSAKSKFFDVLEKEKESKLISFVLHNAERSVGVDLRDGHFEINGIPFFQHRPDLNSYKEFRVIYYRTVQRTMNMIGQEIESGVLAYSIGWQVTYKNENVQRTLMV